MSTFTRGTARKRAARSITLRNLTARKTHRHAPASRKQEGSKARGKSAFTQRDIGRAIKALEKQGKTVGAVSFDGFSVLLTTNAAHPVSTNEWDDALIEEEGV